MYIVPPLWPHILWIYWGRNDSELVLWPVEWRLISAGHSLSFSVWSESSLSAWRNLRSLGTHREMSRSFFAKSRGMSLRNFAEFCGVFPRNFAEKTLGEISDFYFFSAKSFVSRKVCSAAKREKRAFFFGWSVYFSNCITSAAFLFHSPSDKIFFTETILKLCLF